MWTRRAVLASGAATVASLLLPTRGQAATDTLQVALRAEPDQLDPTVGGAPATLEVSYRNIFEGLTAIDEHKQVQPGLAKSWTLAPDGRALRFTLQNEVRFHDGTSFDAAHVVFSIERLLAPASGNPQRGLFAAIDGVKAIDPATVEITLRQPDAALLYKLGLPAAVMVAPESADNNRTVPLGTGPFAFIEWDAGTAVALERNEDYWGPHPQISAATIVFIADPQAGIAALRARQIDGYHDFPAPEALAPLRQDPAYRIVTGTWMDSRPMVGVWDAQLAGMWTDSPLGGLELAGLRWT